jgi:hypothetical protein
MQSLMKTFDSLTTENVPPSHSVNRRRNLSWGAGLACAVLSWMMTAPAVAASTEMNRMATVADDRPRIELLVRHLGNRGILLTELPDGWWVVNPRGANYGVIVKFRVYREDATAETMQRDLTRVNLAFIVNPGARIAISAPGIRGPVPAGTRLEHVPLRRELIQAFETYTGDR